MTDTAIVIGGGMAGVSAAAALSPDFKVILLERERFHAVHATGRSAASFIPSYGYEDSALNLLTKVSGPVLESQLHGASEVSLLKPRGLLTMYPLAMEHALDADIKSLRNHFSSIEYLPDLQSKFPDIGIDPGFATAGIFEPDCADIDVDALLQTYLRQLKANNGTVVLGANIKNINRMGDDWQIVSETKTYNAAVIVNCAGAWADEVAAMAGAGSAQLTPKRRTAITFSAPLQSIAEKWPLILSADESFYLKPDAGKLLASPADATPSEPCDAQALEIDIATAAYNVEQALNFKIKTIDHSWAGLRTFAPDGSPVIGEDSIQTNFFWFAGQGGHGIQIAPAASTLLASLICKRNLPQEFTACGFDPQWVSPARIAQA